MTNKSVLKSCPLLPYKQFNTYTRQTIMAIHKLNISFSRPFRDWPIIKKFCGTSIDQIIESHSTKEHLKENLNKYQIMIIEQFLNTTNSEFVNWTDFHHNIKRIPRGRKPKWFLLIQELISSAASPSLTLMEPNPFITPPWTAKRGWVITAQGEFGKVLNPFPDRPKVKHYIKSPLENQKLVPCLGCHLKNPKFKRIYCYFLAHKQTIFNLQVDSKSRIHANLKDISRMLKAKKPFLLNNTQLQPSL